MFYHVLASISAVGIYPIVGWKIGNDLIYLAEAAIKDTGTVMDWLTSVGIIDNVAESSAMADSVSDSHGVYFVTGFSGLPVSEKNSSSLTQISLDPVSHPHTR